VEALLVVLPVIAGVSLVLIVLIRWLAGGLDESRIRSYLKDRGGEVLAIRSVPTRPGAVVEGSGRAFLVRHRDKDGQVHEGRFRTSLWEGVHITEDRVVES